MLKIWGRATSSNVKKVLWCCEELGIPFERIDVGGPFGGNKEPAYLKLNPNGLVPTVEDEGLVIWESNTILRHLASTRAGGEALYPRDPAIRTQVERWMDWQISRMAGYLTILMVGWIRTTPEKRDAVALEEARHHASELWRMLEAQLESRDYLAGKSLTLADICLGNMYYMWTNVPVERPKLSALKAWGERIAQRPGYRKYVAIPLA